MQKLVFRNADGTEIDLTSGAFGITEWEGFSSVDLNLQTQQVPFYDGSVYLDGLLGEREISVTLAMQDNNNLERRYELRRQLISVLNPKLGEGILIYTNDYISKRIKAVPQVPVFENHNSNDSGTPKASLSWTCPSPYWEDLEETIVPLSPFVSTPIENKGDIPACPEIVLYTTNAENLKIENLTDEDKIELQGTIENIIDINTEIGKKDVQEKRIGFEGCTFISKFTDEMYCKKLKLFVATSSNGISISKDGKKWSIVFEGQFNSVCYSELKNLFVACGEIDSETCIFTSTDGYFWTKRIGYSVIDTSFNKVRYIDKWGIFVCVDWYGWVWTSQDGVTWNDIEVAGVNFIDLAFSPSLNILVLVSGTKIITSTDGENFTVLSDTYSGIKQIIWNEARQQFLIVGNLLYTSTDGENWTSSDIGYVGVSIVYSSRFNAIYIGTNAGKIIKSTDGEEWQEVFDTGYTNPFLFVSTYDNSIACINNESDFFISTDGENFTSLYQNPQSSDNDLYTVVYSNKLKKYFSAGVDYIYKSEDGLKFEVVATFSGNLFVKLIEYQDYIVAISQGGYIYKTSDGENWEQFSISWGGVSNLKDAVVVNDKLYVCGSGGVAYGDFSTTWTSSLISGVVLNGITYSKKNNLFVVVGNNAVVYTTNDLTTWTQRNSGATSIKFNSVACSDVLNLFVIVGENGSMIASYDTITWFPIDLENGDYTKVVYLDNINMFCCIGGFTLLDQIILKLVDLTGLKSYPSIISGKCVLKDISNIDKDGNFCIVGTRLASQVSFLFGENSIINKLSSDSNLDFKLKQGESRVLLSSDNGGVSGTIKYRQKYIGV